jgi:16S rRNA (guanine527-N7)-methyltransferase
VKAQQVRVEELKGDYDFIGSRAVARMQEFYGWVKNKSRKESAHSLDNGILYLKGGDLEEELEELKKPYALYSLSDYFTEAFFETKKVVFIPL